MSDKPGHTLEEDTKTASSSSHTRNPSEQTDARRKKAGHSNNWSKHPLLKVIIPPVGKYSIKTDERCFSFCSQSSGGRTRGQKPWCRSICFRKVYDHELESAMSQHASGSAFSGKVRIPLPPEGQPRIETTEDDDEDSGVKKEVRAKRERSRYWEPGWYIWYTKSHWAIQEHMSLMAHSITTQDHLLKMKLDIEQQIESGEYVNLHDKKPNTPRRQIFWSTVRTSDQATMQKLSIYPFPLHKEIRQLLQPTQRLFSIFQNSITSGDQRKLAELLWETAKSDAPYRLARNVLAQTWERFRGNSDKDK